MDDKNCILLYPRDEDGTSCFSRLVSSTYSPSWSVASLMSHKFELEFAESQYGVSEVSKALGGLTNIERIRIAQGLLKSVGIDFNV